MEMVTSSFVMPPHGPLSTVQRNTFAPTVMALTDVVLVVGDAIVPLPLTRVQLPLAGDVAAFAVKVAFGAVLQAC